MTEKPPLSRPLDLVLVTDNGIERRIVADPAEKERLASEIGLLELRSLVADVRLTSGRGGAIDLDGRINAEIVQACVVSLVPVEQTIDEPFSLRFVRADSRQAPPPPKAGAEIMIDPAAPDPPDVLTGAVLDLGPIVVEHFVLAIDPYPRAPGAALPAAIDEEPAPGADSPFAALAALRSGPSKNG
jgi:uncharacterized metal-binding protein YceD (DUF177 family)